MHKRVGLGGPGEQGEGPLNVMGGGNQSADLGSSAAMLTANCQQSAGMRHQPAKQPLPTHPPPHSHNTPGG